MVNPVDLALIEDGAELPVQLVKHDAGLDLAGLGRLVQREQPIEMPRAVGDDAGANGLAGLRGAAAPRGDGHVLFTSDLEQRLHVRGRTRQHHSHRHDLVERGVRRVAAAIENRGQHLALELRFEPSGKRWIHRA